MRNRETAKVEIPYWCHRHATPSLILRPICMAFYFHTLKMQGRKIDVKKKKNDFATRTTWRCDQVKKTILLPVIFWVQGNDTLIAKCRLKHTTGCKNVFSRVRILELIFPENFVSNKHFRLHFDKALEVAIFVVVAVLRKTELQWRRGCDISVGVGVGVG